MNRLLFRQSKSWSLEKKKQTFQSIQQAWKTTGKSLRELCDSKGISSSTYQKWKRDFRVDAGTLESNGHIDIIDKSLCEECAARDEKIERLQRACQSSEHQNKKLKALIFDILSGEYKPEEVIEDMIENLLK